jgi:hypothetical protein
MPQLATTTICTGLHGPTGSDQILDIRESPSATHQVLDRCCKGGPTDEGVAPASRLQRRNVAIDVASSTCPECRQNCIRERGTVGL